MCLPIIVSKYLHFPATLIQYPITMQFGQRLWMLKNNLLRIFVSSTDPFFGRWNALDVFANIILSPIVLQLSLYSIVLWVFALCSFIEIYLVCTMNWNMEDVYIPFNGTLMLLRIGNSVQGMLLYCFNDIGNDSWYKRVQVLFSYLFHIFSHLSKTSLHSKDFTVFYH